MTYISSLNISTDRTNPFPYNVPAIRYCKNIDIDTPITFFIGDNGTGKSTLIETLAYRLQLPHMDGSSYDKRCFDASRTLIQFLELEYNMHRAVGFFFRAEDFGDYLNSVDRQDGKLHKQFGLADGEVPEHIVQEMKDNANYQLYHMRKNYGQELQSFSHGEAYMKIIQEKITARGIFILDEPEAALSPAKQLSLIYFIQDHLKKYNSQFIIATHSPILMSMPRAKIYEISSEGMLNTQLEETEHYSITKSFLNSPGLYLRHLE
jgi:predicted ATPase